MLAWVGKIHEKKSKSGKSRKELSVGFDMFAHSCFTSSLANEQPRQSSFLILFGDFFIILISSQK